MRTEELELANFRLSLCKSRKKLHLRPKESRLTRLNKDRRNTPRKDFEVKDIPQLKRQLREFIRDFPKEESFAVTLTMKQYTQGQRLDEARASKNLRHFLNRLNRSCFGNAARRNSRRIEVIPNLEKSYSGRLHYHLLMRNPFPDNPVLFEEKIKDCWKKTLFADHQTKIEEAYDPPGWNSYITKDVAKKDERDRSTIDWENYHTA